MNKSNSTKSFEIENVKKVSAKRSKFMGAWYNIPEREDYIGVTEWENGEGFEIVIGDKFISLHRDELHGILYLTQVLDYECVDK